MSGALHAILAAMTISNPLKIGIISDQENGESCEIVGNVDVYSDDWDISEMNDGKIREKWTRHQCLNGEGIVTEWSHMENDPDYAQATEFRELVDSEKNAMLSWEEHIVDLRAHQLLWEREKQMFLLEREQMEAKLKDCKKDQQQMRSQFLRGSPGAKKNDNQREEQKLMLEMQRWNAERAEIHESMSSWRQRQLITLLSHHVHWDQEQQKAMEAEWKERSNLKSQLNELTRPILPKEDQKKNAEWARKKKL